MKKHIKKKEKIKKSHIITDDNRNKFGFKYYIKFNE